MQFGTKHLLFATLVVAVTFGFLNDEDPYLAMGAIFVVCSAYALTLACLYLTYDIWESIGAKRARRAVATRMVLAPALFIWFVAAISVLHVVRSEAIGGGAAFTWFGIAAGLAAVWTARKAKLPLIPF